MTPVQASNERRKVFWSCSFLPLPLGGGRGEVKQKRLARINSRGVETSHGRSPMRHYVVQEKSRKQGSFSGQCRIRPARGRHHLLLSRLLLSAPEFHRVMRLRARGLYHR